MCFAFSQGLYDWEYLIMGKRGRILRKQALRRRFLRFAIHSSGFFPSLLSSLSPSIPPSLSLSPSLPPFLPHSLSPSFPPSLSDISSAWLGTVLAAIPHLPKDVIKRDILNIAVAKGQLSQTVTSRQASCQIIGRMAPKFEPFWLVELHW